MFSVSTDDREHVRVSHDALSRTFSISLWCQETGKTHKLSLAEELFTEALAHQKKESEPERVTFEWKPHKTPRVDEESNTNAGLRDGFVICDPPPVYNFGNQLPGGSF